VFWHGCETERAVTVRWKLDGNASYRVVPLTAHPAETIAVTAERAKIQAHRPEKARYRGRRTWEDTHRFGMMFANSPRRAQLALEGRGRNMSGKMDQVKGRTKEAVGVLVGDKRLEREGKVERAAGDIKEKAGKFAHDVKKKTEKVVDKVKSAIKR
jgi:uncharacterized protein YjbJ (UPF0337 family)